MMAAAARESHRSPSAEKRFLAPPGRESRNCHEEGSSSSRAEMNDDSVVDAGPTVGVAGLAADVGDIGMLFDATSDQRQLDSDGKKSLEQGRGGGGRGNKSRPRGRQPAVVRAASSAVGDDQERAAASASDAFGIAGGENSERASARDAAVPGATKKVPTRERSQQMYETHRQTQEKIQDMRNKSATQGCTFSPQFYAKQKDKKPGGPNERPDHLYQDFQKQLEKRNRLVEEEKLKISFRPVLPTASSRLAARAAANAPTVDGHKRAEEKSKATAAAMYKECTFAPNTIVTKPVTNKLLAAKGKQAAVADRLYASAETQTALLKSREQAKAAEELAACTFRPDTSESSKRASAGSGRSDSGNAHERLFGLHGELLVNKQTKREDLMAKELSECTFSPALVAKPRLSSSSDANKSGRVSTDTCSAEFAGAGVERTEPIHDRLYKLRVGAEARAEKEKGEFLDSECTFQPNLALTKTSLASARSREKAEAVEETRIEALYKHGRQRQSERSRSPRNYTDKLREEDESREMELCTFQPNVSTTQTGRFKTESRGRHLFEALYDQRGDRERATERLRKEDMKACTFSPTLASHKTRLGRSLSPRRERPVYEELYHEAATQRMARTKSAQYLQSQECPFKPNLATARADTTTSGTSYGKTPHAGEERHVSRTPFSAWCNLVVSTATAATAAAASADRADHGTKAAEQQPHDIGGDGTTSATASAATTFATTRARPRTGTAVVECTGSIPMVEESVPPSTSSSLPSSRGAPNKSDNGGRGKTSTTMKKRVADAAVYPSQQALKAAEMEERAAASVAAAAALAEAIAEMKSRPTKTDVSDGVPSLGGHAEAAPPPPPGPTNAAEGQEFEGSEKAEGFDK